MDEVARITNDGDLKITGDINSRSPIILDSLVNHFPFDNTNIGINYKPILPMTWIPDTTGSQTYYGQNGDGNRIINDIDPFGSVVPIWQSINNDTSSDADGGWVSSAFSIDSSKLYRYSVWIKRVVQGNGSYYFGLYNYNISDATLAVIDASSGGTTTNFYFIASSWTLNNDEWYLFVAHLYPEGTTVGIGKHEDSGVYNTKGIKVGGITKDAIMPTGTVKIKHRSYLYYSTIPETDQRWAYPQIEKCDGSEVSLDELINGQVYKTTPSNNTGLIHDVDGVHIENASVNYLNAGLNGYNAFTVSHWNGASLTEVGFEPIHQVPIFRYDTSIEQYTYTHDYILDDDLSTLSEQTVTFSVYIRRLEGSTTGRIRIYDDITSYSYQTIPVTQEFQKFEMQKTIGLNPTRIFVMIDNSGGGIYEFHSPKLEISGYATSFNREDKLKSNMCIKSDIGTEDYTIIGKFNPRTPFQNSSTGYDKGTLNGSNLFNITDNNGGHIYYRFYISGTSSCPYLDPDGTYGTSHIHKYYEIEANKELIYVIRRVGTSFKFKIFQNGIWKDEHISTINATARFDSIEFGNVTIWQGNHKDITIYNRVLTNDELNELIISTFRPRNNGDLIIDRIETKPIIPNDVYYFPLSADCKNEYKGISTVDNTEVSFKDGGCYAGHSINNLAFNNMVPYGGYHTWEQHGNNIKAVFTTDARYLVFRVTGDDLINKTFSFSGILKKNGIPLAYSGGAISTYSNESSSKTNLLIDEVSGYFEITQFYEASTTWMVHYSMPSTYIGDVITIENLQIIERPFIQPTAYPTKGASSLEYNLYNSIGMDWSGEWTIIYKKKPLGTSNTNAFTGYNLESLGCNSNSIGGGYRWFGKKSGENTVGLTSYDAVDINKYFNYWQTVTLIKVGDILTVKWYLSDGQIITKTTSLAGIAFNYFVTQYGYDFKLGGWDNNNFCNTIFKDLIILKRAITADELNKLLNEKMNLSDDKLQVQGNLITGTIF